MDIDLSQPKQRTDSYSIRGPIRVKDSIREGDPETRYERLVEMPVSAKLVFKVLDEEGPLTQQQVINRTMLPPRTTRYAVAELKDAALIEEELYIPDARQTLYRAHPVKRPR